MSRLVRKSPLHRISVAVLVLLLALPGASSLAEVIVASWEVPVPFPTGTGFIPSGNTYLVPNVTGSTGGGNSGTFPVGTAGYPTGTPTYGVLAGNPAALLGAFHSNTSTLYTASAGNGSPYAFVSNFWQPNDYYEAVLPTTEFSTLTLTWDQTRSSTGPATFKLQMSTDGSLFTDLSSYTVAATTWSTGTYNPVSSSTFSLPSSADNQASLTLRFVNTTGTNSATAGSNRIDNVKVTAAVPEPSTVLLATLGLGGCLIAAARVRRRTLDVCRDCFLS